MDRLDAWLNAQLGWRRFALVCAFLYPATVLIGGAVTGLVSGPPGPGARSLFLAMALSIPCVVPLAGLALLAWSSRTRRARRRGKPAPPMLTWRTSLSMLLMASGITISMLQDGESYRWRQAHPELFQIAMALLAAGIVVLFWDAWYQRRITMRS